MEKTKGHLFAILICGVFIFTAIAPLPALSKSFKGNSYICINDSILSKLNFCNNHIKNKFFNVGNVSISADYEIKDSISLLINNDLIPDKILVLSPTVNNDDDAETSACRNSRYNKRLFVVLLSNNTKFHVSTINENLILNEHDSQSEPYRKMVAERRGFILEYFIGSVNKCYFNFHCSIRDANIYLISNEYNCYRTDLTSSKKGTRKYNEKIDNVDIYKHMSIP